MSKSEAVASPAVQLNVNEPSSAIPSKTTPNAGEAEAVAYRVDEYSHAACSYTSWGFYMFCGLCMLLVVLVAAIAALVAAVVAVREFKTMDDTLLNIQTDLSDFKLKAGRNFTLHYQTSVTRFTELENQIAAFKTSEDAHYTATSDHIDLFHTELTSQLESYFTTVADLFSALNDNLETISGDIHAHIEDGYNATATQIELFAEETFEAFVLSLEHQDYLFNETHEHIHTVYMELDEHIHSSHLEIGEQMYEFSNETALHFVDLETYINDTLAEQLATIIEVTDVLHNVDWPGMVDLSATLYGGIIQAENYITENTNMTSIGEFIGTTIAPPVYNLLMSAITADWHEIIQDTIDDYDYPCLQ